MVADAVTVELVSRTNFPGIRDKYREIIENAAVRRSLTTKKPSCHGTLLTNSLSNRTGNDLRENRDRNIR